MRRCISRGVCHQPRMQRKIWPSALHRIGPRAPLQQHSAARLCVSAHLNQAQLQPAQAKSFRDTPSERALQHQVAKLPHLELSKLMLILNT